MAFVSHIRATQTGTQNPISTAFHNMLERFKEYRLYRKTLAELNQLSDRELADIGLSRSMARRVAFDATHKN